MTVYLLGCEGTRLVKIGHAKDVRRRLREISTMSAHPLRVLWQSGPEHGEPTERLLHVRFHKYRQHGEWFDFGDADPVESVRSAIDLQGTLPPSRPKRHPVSRGRSNPERSRPQVSTDPRIAAIVAALKREIAEIDALAATDPQAGMIAAHRKAQEIERVNVKVREARRESIVGLVESGWSHQEVADLLGMTRARVGAILKSADLSVPHP